MNGDNDRSDDDIDDKSNVSDDGDVRSIGIKSHVNGEADDDNDNDLCCNARRSKHPFYAHNIH